MARSPLLSMLKREPIDEVKVEWETATAPARLFTADGGTDTTIDTSGATSNKYVSFTSVAGLQKGDLIRNVTRATPVGTYGADEIMQVVGISGTVAEVKRDFQYRNTGTGSAVHTHSDVFEVISRSLPEGSSPDVNMYADTTLVYNETQIYDYYLTVTGSQYASRRLLGGDTIAAQTAMGVRRLSNWLEKTFLYGALNHGGSGTEVDAYQGSDSYTRSSKGLQQFVQVASGNVDYTTGAVTETALNSLFADIMADNTDAMDNFIIVCNPKQARVISHFGEDSVYVSQKETVWGRSINRFKTDLGVEADVLWTTNCSQSDLFIIDTNKCFIEEFRPWKQAEWTYNSDGVDAWRQRTLGEYSFKIVDGLYSHAALGKLTWL